MCAIAIISPPTIKVVRAMIFAPMVYIYIYISINIYMHIYIYIFWHTHICVDMYNQNTQREGTSTSRCSYLVVVFSNWIPNNWAFLFPTWSTTPPPSIEWQTQPLLDPVLQVCWAANIGTNLPQSTMTTSLQKPMLLFLAISIYLFYWSIILRVCLSKKTYIYIYIYIYT